MPAAVVHPRHIPEGVPLALEMQLTETDYQMIRAARALKAANHDPTFGFTFDPSLLVHVLLGPFFVRGLMAGSLER